MISPSRRAEEALDSKRRKRKTFRVLPKASHDIALLHLCEKNSDRNKRITPSQGDISTSSSRQTKHIPQIGLFPHLRKLTFYSEYPGFSPRLSRPDPSLPSSSSLNAPAEQHRSCLNLPQMKCSKLALVQVLDKKRRTIPTILPIKSSAQLARHMTSKEAGRGKGTRQHSSTKTGCSWVVGCFFPLWCYTFTPLAHR